MAYLLPICAAGALLHSKRRYAVLAFSAVVVGFAAYALVLRHELVLIDGIRNAFGTNSFLIRDRTGAIILLTAVAILASLGMAYLLGRRRSRATEASTRLFLYWGGAGIFVGTWALSENNYDYRLTFTLLAVPQLLEWASQGRPAMPFARLALFLLVATLWLSDTAPLFNSGLSDPWIRAETHFPFDDLLIAVLVVYFAAGLALTLPPWLHDASTPQTKPSRACPRRRGLPPPTSHARSLRREPYSSRSRQDCARRSDCRRWCSLQDWP